MMNRKQAKARVKVIAIMGLVLMILLSFAITIPVIAFADNTTRQTQNFSNPNWQAMFYGGDEGWNWMHNWAYMAPTYHFESTFPADQWGRPTTSNVAADRPQNIRRDRHSAALPPPHGSDIGFFSGEFPTGQLNPFAPRDNNNPAASRAVAIEESVFALRPGESGVNVRADGSHAGGFLASTSVIQGGSGGNMPHGSSGGDSPNPPWASPGNQADSSGFTVTHVPIGGAGASHSGTQTNQPMPTQPNRITTVTPFADGTIARIMIPALGNRAATVRSGVDLATLDSYIGHFPSTSQWDGTIALASHNRGRGSFFAGIWTLRHGDVIFYETTLGVRAYEVISIEQISENDMSVLDHSHENMLVFITCVYGRPDLRWALRARQVG